jgi:hypothetical protein
MEDKYKTIYAELLLSSGTTKLITITYNNETLESYE